MTRIAGFSNAHTANTEHQASQLDQMINRLPGTHVQSTKFETTEFARRFAREADRDGLLEDDRVLIVIDGHILNADELAQEFNLPSRDVDIIRALYEKVGFGALMEKLVGEYAIALFDKETKQLYLGRDRIGVKPLYYAYNKDVCAFSSLPFALLDLPGVSRTPDKGFVSRFLGLHYRLIDNIVTDSPFADVKQLPAGHWVCLQDGEQQLESYWQLENKPDWPESETDLAKVYRAKLMKAVERRYNVADKALFTLSGGMDSSSVVTCASEVSGKKQFAISSVYTDKTFDEREEIQDVVEERIEKWFPIELDNDIDIFAFVKEMVNVHNEPVVTATWLSHFQLCREISDMDFSALFGGLGGDELNAGEYEYFPMLFADLKQAGKDEVYDHEVTEWARYHDHPIHKKNHLVAKDYLERMTDENIPGRIFHDPERMFRYAKAVNKDYVDLDGFTPDMDAPYESYLKNRTYHDLIRETTPCCLRAEDRQCTYFGIEHFDPFLDHELVEFMFRVPGEMKIRDGITKRLLREAMSGVLPDETRKRIKKTGWNAPAHLWFYGENLNRLRDMVRDPSFEARGIYNVDAILAIIDDHEKIVTEELNRENHMMFLWQLLNMECWLKAVDELH